MAEAEEGGHDKPHEATPRRLEQARARGDAPRSQDAQTLAAYVGLTAALLLGGGWSAVALGEALRPALADPAALAADILGQGGGGALPEMLGGVLRAARPAVALPAAGVLALLLAQRAIVPAPEKIAPKLSRISPIANARQKYGLTGLVEFAKSSLKVAAVAGVLYWAVAREMPAIAAAAGAPVRALGPLLDRQLTVMLSGVLAVSAAVAVLDLLWQAHDFARRNRMSHQELREETRQTEGDPQLRAERRARARANATNRMMLDVPKADVVVTNPSHVAVALAWDRAPGSAPRCLAKGVDEVALRIREVAARAGVPVREDPATARSLHALVAVGHEIRPEHYKAVAAAILFADRMRARARAARAA